MTNYVNATITDLRGGRQSWRVVLLLCLPSFALAVALPFVQYGF